MDRIFLQLENDVCAVKVTAVKHPYHRVYRILFDDGYENIFFTDVETGSWIEEDLGETTLAASFGTKVFFLADHIFIPTPENKSLAWCKASAADKIVCFGFYTFTAQDDTIFEVYGDNRKFLYVFRRSAKRWKVYDVNGIIQHSRYNDFIKIAISIFTGLAGYG